MSPLTRRLPRELRNNLGKYLGIFLLMAGAIALTGGFLLAASSIDVIIGNMREDYNIEDARFTCDFEATDEQLDAVREAADSVGGSTIYELFSVDAALESVRGGSPEREATVRLYRPRTQVDMSVYAEGRAPETASEIGLDRCFASNSGIALGDTITLSGHKLTVVGIVTFADQQALFENNSDFTLNAITFGVAELTDEGFNQFAAELPLTYTYALTFNNRELTVAERTNAETDILEALAEEDARVSDLIDRDSNQGIVYAAEDTEGDAAMWEVLLMMIIVIMAFAFVVLTNSTIEEESAIIGTLLASGWRTRELVLHYLTLPAIVGAAGCIGGTLLGVTLLEKPMWELYYNSYSLPPYHMTWNWNIFIKCAVVPFALLVGVTLVGLLRTMGKTPLQFLRHELGRGGTRRGLALPERLGFVARFRLRVFLRNFGNFVTLFLGIAFASMILLFGLAVLPTMSHYAEGLRNNMVAEHQYTLKMPVDLTSTDEERARWEAYDLVASVEDIDDLGLSEDDEDTLVRRLAHIGDDDHAVNLAENSEAAIAQAESYAVYQLDYDRGEELGYESITIYGIREDSRYWEGLDLTGGRIVFGNGLIDKFGLAEGSSLTLWDKYNDATYKLSCDASWGSLTDMSIYLDLDTFNALFGNPEGYFNAYASNEDLAIDARWLASELTPEDMDKIGLQMTTSMGDMMNLLLGIAVFIFLIFIYLLTKAVIDRSARSISYMKVFGYRDREVSLLYVRSITWCVAISLVACLPVIVGGLTIIFKAMLMEYSGNIEIYVPNEAYVQCVATGFATYLAVVLLHLRAIRRVPMALALKVQE